MRFARAAAAAVAVAALLVPGTAYATTDHTGAAAARQVRAPGKTVTLPVRDALAQLPVRQEDRTGYDRSQFKHWIDADRDGCNTRAEVLKAEAVVAPEQGSRCALAGGQWYSPYDDRYISGPSGLDIDHLVPLAEAWDSGASAWTAAEREAYANDLGDDRALIAVSAASNRSKADQDPTTWLPPATAYRCQYVEAATRRTVNLDGWTLRDEDGHTFTFRHVRLDGRSTVRVHTGVGRDTRTDVFQDRRAYVWNNDHDTATLRNDRGRFIDDVSWGRHRGHRR